MVKIYLKYNLRRSFGVICSAPCNVCFDKTDTLAITGALEQICIWNIRKGTLVAELGASTHENKRHAVVTRIALSPNGKHLAAGYVYFPKPTKQQVYQTIISN